MELIWAELHRLLKSTGTLAVEGRLRPPSRMFQPLMQQRRMSRYRKISSSRD
jgi:hypothetical protein